MVDCAISCEISLVTPPLNQATLQKATRRRCLPAVMRRCVERFHIVFGPLTRRAHAMSFISSQRITGIIAISAISVSAFMMSRAAAICLNKKDEVACTEVTSDCSRLAPGDCFAATEQTCKDNSTMFQHGSAALSNEIVGGTPVGHGENGFTAGSEQAGGCGTISTATGNCIWRQDIFNVWQCVCPSEPDTGYTAGLQGPRSTAAPCVGS